MTVERTGAHERALQQELADERRAQGQAIADAATRAAAEHAPKSIAERAK